MNLIRKIGITLLKTIWFFTEFVIGFVLIYFDLAIVFSAIPFSGEELGHGVKIYVKSNGIHTDVCVPVTNEYKDWRDFLPVTHFPKVKEHKYVSIGWGDKGFFLDTPTWGDLTFSTAFNAAFLPSATAMHVQYFESEPMLSETTKSKFISPKRYLKLVEFISDSFEKTDGDIDLIANRGYWHNDNFYEAKGSYHLFNTCNVWTNEPLKVAGIKTAWLALFPDGIMKHLE